MQPMAEEIQHQRS